MKIITISREFGSGGRELGKRMADVLGFAYYDREIIAAIAKKNDMDENYVAHALENNVWEQIPLTFRSTFAGETFWQGTQTNLLVEQRKVIEEIAKQGKDCIIVGRNADVILEEYEPFKIFVCSDMGAKIQRCIERAKEGEDISPKTLEKNIKRVDKGRAQTREIVTGQKWGRANGYNMTVNTASWNLKELAPVVAEFALKWFDRKDK